MRKHPTIVDNNLIWKSDADDESTKEVKRQTDTQFSSTSTDHPSALAEDCAIANTASEDTKFGVSPGIESIIGNRTVQQKSGEEEELGHSMVSIGKEDQQELMSLSV